MRIPLSDSENVSRGEFKLNNKRIEDKIKVVETCVMDNKDSIDKLSHIILGNGSVGLFEKVNLLFHRNQLVDKAVTVLVGICSSLLTLYLTGVLHL